MQKKSASQSGIFNPRVLVAFALCSFGVLLGMFSLAATPLSALASGAELTARSESSLSRKPGETTRANTSVPPDPANFLSTFGGNANRLPPGVPLPPGAQFSANGQGDPSSSSPTAGFPGAGMPLRPGTASGANSPGNPLFGPQQPAASETMPLAPTAAGDWSIVSSPNAPAAQPIGTFNGVACVSASNCWAVGYGHNGTAYQTLIEHWDGTSWTIVDSPSTSATQFNLLSDVTCVSASDCWAVGYSSTGSAYQTLILRWDGISWAIVASPNASATDVLSDVTCLSASDCWAVGYTYSSIAGASQTLVEHWDGTSWTVVSSPNTSATQGNSLSGVTCVSASDCWAVGSASGGTLTEHWDGTSWVIVTSPNRSGYSNGLSSVTCVSTSDCWAVGTSPNGNDWRTLIEHWDGSSWAIVSSPNPSALQMNNLADVTCVSASDCRAVGGYYPGTTWQTLTLRWDGTSWSVVSSPSVAGHHNFPSAIACVSASNCSAVGSSWTNTSYETLAMQWDGTSWTIVASPNTTGYNANVLSSAACASASDCWAVGHYYPDAYGPARTLIEHWDGTAWTVVASPNAGSQENRLSDVTCVSAADCWAVGHYYGEGGPQTLIMRWNGASPSPSWAIVTSANTALSLANYLSGVACVSASNCWAVGTHYAGSPSRTLIQHWDGTAWTLVASPNPGSPDPGARQRNELSDVTCVSASNCWAVGSYDADSPVPQDIGRPKISRTLIARWDGTAWTAVPSPDTLAVEQQFLSGVTCVSASDCWAVGYSYNGFIPQTFVGQFDPGGTGRQTLIKRWDGNSWSIVTSPNTSSTQSNYLKAVTCRSASDCWAVGNYLGDSAYQTLIQRWDGTSWAIVASPNTNATQDNLLFGVTCGSALDCWAIGAYATPGFNFQTLTVKYTGPAPPTPTKVVSRKTHGTAGNFDINLPLAGNPGIECRSGGANNDYQVVFTFPSPVTFSGATATPAPGGTGSVSSTSSSPDGTAVTVNLTGVTNAQTITITLAGVDDGTNTGDVSVPMGVLLGDTTANGAVNSSDISQTKSKSGQAVTSANFRQDVTINGAINSSDISLVKSKSGTGLP